LLLQDISIISLPNYHIINELGPFRLSFSCQRADEEGSLDLHPGNMSGDLAAVGENLRDLGACRRPNLHN